MRPTDIYDEAVARLGQRNRVDACEELKRRATGLVEHAGGLLNAESTSTSPEEERDQFLESLDEPAEAFVASALPLIEYGNADDHVAIAQAVQHVVDRTAASESALRIPRISAEVLIGRIIWAMGTYALVTRRLDALVALGGVVTRRPYERPPIPVVDDHTYRYPEALGGNAGNSFTDYRGWLESRELCPERLPYVQASLETAFGETDLLLALRANARFGGRTYSAGKRRHIIQSLSARFADPRQRKHLAEFFSVDEASLDDHVDEAYARLEHDRNLSFDVPNRMLGSEND